MAAQQRLICSSEALQDGGSGVRFEIQRLGRPVPAFAIRHRGRVHGYVNECGHIPVELDWQEGEFFDASRLYLVCSTHGALYDPATGACLGGRCNRRGLVPVRLVEQAGNIYIEDEHE